MASTNEEVARLPREYAELLGLTGGDMFRVRSYEKAARDAGVRFAIDSDAHSVPNLGNMPYGAGAGRRGWLTADDVINTWPLGRLREFLNKNR